MKMKGMCPKTLFSILSLSWANNLNLANAFMATNTGLGRIGIVRTCCVSPSTTQLNVVNGDGPSGDYYSSFTTEELQKIAYKKGYDTFGMDRDGLETIARGFKSEPIRSRSSRAASVSIQNNPSSLSSSFASKPKGMYNYGGEIVDFANLKYAQLEDQESYLPQQQSNQNPQKKQKLQPGRKTQRVAPMPPIQKEQIMQNTPKTTQKMKRQSDIPKLPMAKEPQQDLETEAPKWQVKLTNKNKQEKGQKKQEPQQQQSVIQTTAQVINGEEEQSLRAKAQGQAIRAQQIIEQEQQQNLELERTEAQAKKFQMIQEQQPELNFDDIYEVYEDYEEIEKIEEYEEHKVDYRQFIRSSLIGFFVGSVAISPITYAHNNFFPAEVLANPSSQWEFDTLVGGLSGAAFAAVYRYFIKEDKDETVTNGVITAFVIGRTFSRIRVGRYCEGLYCGAPLGLLDWDMLSQTLLSCAENIALFGATALVMEYFYKSKFISKVEPDNE